MTNTSRPAIITVVVSIVLIFLGVFHQPDYPTTWFDEGLVLQGAMNLARYGKYAMLSVEGFRILDQPLTANGPGIVLPVSAVFKVFGTSLLGARLLMAVYLFFAVFLFHKVSKLLFGTVAAFLSTLALLAVPAEGFLLYGRQALGNVPALVYFLAGCYFFFLLVDRKVSRFAYLVGFFWGLALLTKSQYWIVLPVMAILAVLDLVYYKQIGLKSALIMIVVPLGCLVLWQIVQYLLIGAESYGQYVASVLSSTKVSVFALHAMRIPGNIWYLIRSGFPIFVLSGLFIAVLYSLRQHTYSIVSTFLVLFVVSWSFWYVFISVGWHRYAFEAYSIGTLFFGMVCVKSYQSTFPLTSNDTGWSWRLHGRKLATGSFLVLAFVWGMWVGLGQIQRILFPPERDPQKFAEYLQAYIPPEAVIESWEWEIDVLTPGLRYHHPTNDWVDRKTAETQLVSDQEDKAYNLFEFNPEYLIDGPFSKFTGIYADSIAAGCCVPITDVGDYSLYKIIQVDNSCRNR